MKNERDSVVVGIVEMCITGYLMEQSYMMCSLYASVQGINDSPFLPQRVWRGLQLYV